MKTSIPVVPIVIVLCCVVATAPRITSFLPRTGPIAGFNQLTIYGEFLSGDAPGDVSSVRVAGIDAEVLSHSADQIVVRLGNAHAPTTGNIQVVSSLRGEYFSTREYAYANDVSVIVDIFPHYGPATGGAHVTLAGFFLTNELPGDILSVRLADVNADVLSRTHNRIVVRTQNPGAPTSGIARVISAAYGEMDSIATYVGTYTYDPTASVVHAIYPSYGPLNGGAYVTITGVFLTNEETGDITSVRIAETNAAVVSRTATEIVAKTGTATSERIGTVRIVSAAFGEILSNVEYEYSAQASVITEIFPAEGPVKGSNKITIRGRFLTNEDTGDITSVRVANVNAAVVSRTSEEVVIRLGRAARAITGTVRILSTAYGEILSDAVYSYHKTCY